MPPKVQVSDLVFSLTLLGGGTGTFKREGVSGDFQNTKSTFEEDYGIIAPSLISVSGCCVSALALFCISVTACCHLAQNNGSSAHGPESLKLRARKLLLSNTKRFLKGYLE